MTTHTAFFYGTLMAPQVLSRVTGHSTTTLTIRPAILPDYRRHRVRGADYPAISPQAGSTVRGALVGGLSDSDLHRLDVFEGSEYERIRTRARILHAEKGRTVEEAGSAETVLGVDTSLEQADDDAPSRGNGEQGTEKDLSGEVPCDTYVWKAGRSNLEDEEWDFDEFVREKLWRWAGSDNEYREVDEAVRAQREDGGGDPTGGRNFLDGTFERALQAKDGE